MRSAPRTSGLDPSHAQAIVLMRFDRRVVDRKIKARPSAPRLKLGVGREQLRPAGDAVIHAVVMILVQRTGKGPLGPFLANDMVLLRSQLRPPLRLRLFHLFYF